MEGDEQQGEFDASICTTAGRVTMKDGARLVGLLKMLRCPALFITEIQCAS